MYIIGILLLFILPFAAGCACKGILRWKETSQIETYLIGFFFLFFLQGVVLVPCVFLNMDFATVSMALMGVIGVMFVIGLLMAGIASKRAEKAEDSEEKKKSPWRKKDKFLYVCANRFLRPSQAL